VVEAEQLLYVDSANRILLPAYVVLLLLLLLLLLLSVCCLHQPRRVAAMSVAKRVSEEMGVELGQEVTGRPKRGGGEGSVLV
jgi:hypothetical protein